MGREIILYSAQMCGDCQNLKAFMDANGVDYELRDVREQPQYADELEAKTGKQGVPFLVIDGEWIRGYDPGLPFSDEFARKTLGLAN